MLSFCEAVAEGATAAFLVATLHFLFLQADSNMPLPSFSHPSTSLELLRARLSSSHHKRLNLHIFVECRMRGEEMADNG